MKNGSAMRAGRYYGLHMVEGVAEYRDTPDGEPYRIFLGEDVLKRMDPTYEGRPFYLLHVDKVGERPAAGYVVQSFYNEKDGKHWAEFMCLDEEAAQKIKAGWQLSNSYQPKRMSAGGLWHGVEYAKEVTDGEYDHLALVPDPRYQESVILTPDEFKLYNEEKAAELVALRNSKGGSNMFDFLKRAKVDNSKDLSEMDVVLPKSKKTVSVEKILNDADEAFKKHMDDAKKHKLNDGEEMAHPEHKVELHDGRMMSVNEMVEEHKKVSDMYSALEKEHNDLLEKIEMDPDHVTVEQPSHNDDDPDVVEKGKELAEEVAVHEKEEAEAAEKKKNAKAALEELKKNGKVSNALLDKLKQQKVKNEADKTKAAAEKAAADKLRNAPVSTYEAFQNALKSQEAPAADVDKTARGKKRYGSAS